ncbi:MAG: hydroxysqualene dehydroxylase HpnE [Alphaproteobacteria bacterium]|nr:hydroxysqualene dehydroxylase HpnE [Alphaproteobacteria bacterium]
MRAHVIGAGLAGLSAALALADQGRAVTVYEAGPQAGGRCRSYFDRALGCTVDNGNHLLLSGNRAAMAFLERIGARDSLAGPGEPCFPFMDLESGRRWTLRPSAGRIPWWILDPARRVPGTRARDYLGLVRLGRAGPDATVASVLANGPLYQRLVEPLTVASLNTRPEEATTALLAAVVRETLMRGGAASIPLFPRASLAASLVDPALGALKARGGRTLFGHRIAAIRTTGGCVAALDGPAGTVPVAPDEPVVLAVPPWVATDLVAGLIAPLAFEAVLNIHFGAEAERGPAGFVALLGGTAQWVFVKPGHVSVTISAANRFADEPAEQIALRVWPEIRAALRLADPMPPWRVVREKRATFAATATEERRRPGARSALANLALAGDWTATGLPATIEGAIRSGRTAAELFPRTAA